MHKAHYRQAFSTLFLLANFFSGLFISGHALSSEAQPKNLCGKRTISVDSGYFTSGHYQPVFNSLIGWQNFYLEVNQGRTALFDMAANTNWGARHRGLLLLIDLIPQTFFFTSTVIPYHEWGHAFSMRAAGYTEAGVMNNHAQKDGRVYENPLLLSIRHFFSPFTIPCAVRQERTWLAESSFEGVDATTRAYLLRAFKFAGEYLVHVCCTESPQDPGVQKYVANERDLDILMSAAGPNSQVSYAGALDDALVRRKGHVTDGLFYMANKLSVGFTPEDDNADGDYTSVLCGYKQKNYAISRKNMKVNSFLSFFLSSSSHAYIYSLINFVHTGQTQATPFEPFGVRMPDVEAYILTKGLSMKVKSGYRVSETLHFPVAIEFLTHGEKGAEYTLGCEKEITSLNHLTLGCNPIFGQALNWESFIRAPLGDRAFIEGRAAYYSLKGFMGQRLIPSLKNGSSSYSFALRAGLRY